MTFGDWETSENSSFKNIRLERLKEIKQAINWGPIETVFTETYEPGQNKVGQPAYPPLMLFRCLLLQKWFRVDSDPELESQIKSFAGIGYISNYNIMKKIFQISEPEVAISCKMKTFFVSFWQISCQSLPLFEAFCPDFSVQAHLSSRALQERVAS